LHGLTVMKVKSLALEGTHLRPVEVELVLIPGLPQIHFLGLPDQIIKESIHRIKSAIRSQGFEFPKTKQILVNIRPQHIKKSSRGLELAVAAALLWETGQLPKPLEQNNYFVYGELGLSGEVYEPEDLREFLGGEDVTVLTGASNEAMLFTRHCAETLRNLTQPEIKSAQTENLKANRPIEGLQCKFPKSQARLLEILAFGGHHALLAGPSGSGKSTMARSLVSFMETPSLSEMIRMRQSWRPMISPHHSISALSMVGGGVPPKPGEISKAHGGLLVMDELLEFTPAAQEALREPLEEGAIRLTRGLKSETFSSRFQLLATTNLCPCGQWVPGTEVNCRFSRSRCTSYQQKLSGPFLDRFEVLFFTKKASNESQKRGQEILDKLERARTWKKKQSFSSPAERFDSFLRNNIWPKDFSSRRRQNAAYKVALTIADLEQSAMVKPEYVEEALSLSVYPFEKLARGF
jgi:magnesium chelatase family protein